MKKNKMMRIASFLLVAVLMSTCAISGTFAKYVTSDSATDDARVAKWGVTVAVSGNLFGKNYAKKDVAQTGDSIIASTGNSTDITVANKTADKNIVAPGTKNNVGMNIKISGQPEVAYQISTATSGTQSDIYLAEGTYGVMVEATGLNAATDVSKYYTKGDNDDDPYTAATGNWDSGKTYYKLIDQAEVASGGYYPIAWKLSKVTTTQNDTITLTEVATENTVEALFTEIKTLVNGISEDDRQANDPIDFNYTITWEWKFEDNNDAADTILGHLQAGDVNVVKLGTNNTYTAPSAVGENPDYCLTVAFGISVTVTQVD